MQFKRPTGASFMHRQSILGLIISVLPIPRYREFSPWRQVVITKVRPDSSLVSIFTAEQLRFNGKSECCNFGLDTPYHKNDFSIFEKQHIRFFFDCYEFSIHKSLCLWLTNYFTDLKTTVVLDTLYHTSTRRRGYEKVLPCLTFTREWIIMYQSVRRHECMGYQGKITDLFSFESLFSKKMKTNKIVRNIKKY